MHKEMNTNKPIFNAGKQSVAGRFLCEVLDGNTGKIVQSLPWQKNLVTDRLLDEIVNRTYEANMSHCVVGEGTTPMTVDSGTTVASRSGSTVTADGSIFTDGDDTGAIIKWDTGEEAYISSVTSPTVVETIGSGAISSGEFTIHRVQMDQHESETKRTSTYSTESGHCGFSYNGTLKTNTIWRTFLFTSEGSPITYNEIGISNTSSAAANLNARAIISGGVSLSAGQQLRVKYELVITLQNPNTSESTTAAITNVAAQSATQMAYLRGIREIDAPGTGGNSLNYQALEPSSNMRIGAYQQQPDQNLGGDFASFTGQHIGNDETEGQGDVKDATPGAYSSGQHYRDWSVTFGVLEANGDLSFLCFMASTGYCSLVVKMDTTFEKTSLQTLTLTFRLSWGRTLVN